MSENPDPRCAILRAAGHSEAASLLESLSALDAKPAADPEPQHPMRQATEDEIAEIERQALGQRLLEKMNADLGIEAPQ